MMERRFGMATSSIFKQFVVKDSEAFERLLRDAERAQQREAVQVCSALEKWREALKRFSPRDENSNSSN